jgi:hypothetical protein
MTTCGFIRLAAPAVVLTTCTDNLVVHGLPETTAFGNDRATVKGHVVNADGAAMLGRRSRCVQATSPPPWMAVAFVIDFRANTNLTLAATASSVATLMPQTW